MIRRSVVRGMDESVGSAVGAIAEYRLIDGKSFVYWNGDLWPLHEDFDPAELDGSLEDRGKVEITSMENGIVRIRMSSPKSINTESE